MTYCPCTGHFTVKTGGMVPLVKLVSLKHSFPFDLTVVFDTYSENPRNLSVLPLLESVSIKSIIQKSLHKIMQTQVPCDSGYSMIMIQPCYKAV